VLKLLHWTGDNVALSRQLFRESGLYREKTERKTDATTYLDMSIHNALRKRLYLSMILGLMRTLCGA